MNKENPNIKVLIVVRGGVVQNVYADSSQIEIELLDFDNEEFENPQTADEEFEKIKSGKMQVL